MTSRIFHFANSHRDDLLICAIQGAYLNNPYRPPKNDTSGDSAHRPLRSQTCAALCLAIAVVSTILAWYFFSFTIDIDPAIHGKEASARGEVYSEVLTRYLSIAFGGLFLLVAFVAVLVSVGCARRT